MRCRGGSQDDHLYGNGGIDLLFGEDGNDDLDGGIGADTMVGGIGDDTYYVDNAADVVTENPSEGILDTVYSSVSYHVPENVESLVLTGTMAIGAKGNAQDNSIAGNDAPNEIYGAAGQDIITGNGGRDTLYGGDDRDTLYGGDGDDLLIGGTGLRDQLRGNAGADHFIFATAAECGLSQTDADVLSDFSSADGDKIDLSAIDANVNVAGDQAFTFIGNGTKFSNTAGELRFNAVWVEGDLDGDAVADFFIAVNAPSLSALDFSL